MMRTATTRLSAVALALLVACGGGGGSDSTGPSPTATAVARFAGDSQVATAGTTLPESLAVLVTDSAGHPVANVEVDWSVIGGGSVSPAVAHTNVLGIAKTSRTLGTTAGHGKTTAAVTGLTALQFEAVGQVQGAVTISSNTVATLTDTVLGTLVDPEARPSVKVVDQNNHPVAGVIVVWTATGGGSVTTASVPTDTAGVSTVGYTFGPTKGSSYQAHATVTGLINSPIDFSLTATPGAPAVLEKAVGDNLVVAAGVQIGQSVEITDAHGNPIANLRVDWSASSGGGSVSKAVDSTDANGLAIIQRTLGSGFGTQTTTASTPAIAGTPSVVFSTITAHLVKVVNNAFTPNTITIPAGDSVAWQWQGITALHNITFTPTAGVPNNEGNRDSGLVFRVFATAGTFQYECTNHAGMLATVTVTP